MKKIFTVVFLIIAFVLCVLPLSGCGDKKTYVEEDMSFALTNKTTVMGIPLNLVLDASSGIELKEDGTFVLNLMLNDGAPQLLNNYFDLEAMSKADLSGFINAYVKPIFPGFTLDDVKGSLDLIKNSLGIEIVGLDFEDENVKKLVESLETTGKINSDLVIPEGLGIRYTSFYEIKTLKSETTGKEYTAIFTDKYSEGGEPYFVLTMDTDSESGKKTLNMRVEFLNLTLNLLQR